MGSIGDCYDNSLVESFWGTMQLELLDSKIWKTRAELATAIFEWMASGTLDLAPLISHRLPFERMQEAYELARAHSKGLTAAIFDWRSAHADAWPGAPPA